VEQPRQGGGNLPNIGIVCGYGIVPDKRLRSYCETVAGSVIAQKIETLILTGGHTIEDAPETEARVVWEIMRPQLPNCSFVFEERSLSTLHNLLYAKNILDKYNVSMNLLYVFCDSVRYMKVVCLSKIIFTGYAVRVVKCERKEPLFMYVLQIPFTLLQCVGAVFPPVEKLFFQGRRFVRKQYAATAVKTQSHKKS